MSLIVNRQGAPPMVYHDFSIPLVYSMAFLAMALDKVTSLGGRKLFFREGGKLFGSYWFKTKIFLQIQSHNVIQVFGLRLLKLPHQLLGLLLLLLLLHLLTSWLLF